MTEPTPSPTVYYEAQERAFAPGIADGWPETIPAPHTPNGRLVRLSEEQNRRIVLALYPTPFPDLDALREMLVDPSPELDSRQRRNTVTAFEARVRAEEQAASGHWRERYKELETVTSVVNDERNRLRAEVERLRKGVEEATRLLAFMSSGPQRDGVMNVLGILRAALSTKEGE